MEYNRLGKSGLLVSQLSFGTWVTVEGSSKEENLTRLYELMECAYIAGVNTFDTAETYANGDAEILLGKAIELGVQRKLWDREDLVIITKIFFGTVKPKSDPEYRPYVKTVNKTGLSMKHIIEGLKLSLKRMKLEYCDVVMAHRPDPITPMEEVVRAFNLCIQMGLCFYWGTSEWSVKQLSEAIDIANRLNLIPPIADQSEYNIFHKARIEQEYKPLYPQIGITSFSPIAQGILSGKYKDKVAPEGSRLSKAQFQSLMSKVDNAEKIRPIAGQLNCSLTQLALAWCLKNENVSTVIMGASSLSQMKENLGAIEVLPKLTEEIMKQLNSLSKYEDEVQRSIVDFRLKHVRKSKALL